VSTNKPHVLESADTRALSITRAALVRGSEAVLNVEIDGTPFSLGKLRKEKSHFELDLNIWEGTEEKYTLSVTGQSAEVHLTGYYHPPTFDEEMDEDSSDVEDEIPEVLSFEALEKQKEKISSGKKGEENNVSKEGKTPDKKKEHVEISPGPKKKTPKKQTPEKKESKPDKNETTKEGVTAETAEKIVTSDKSETPDKEIPSKKERKKGQKRALETEGAEKTEENVKKKQKTGGSFLCEKCNRTFNSESGLQSHTKAKHK